MKKNIGETIEKLKTRLSELAVVNTDIKWLLKSGLKKIVNIDLHYENGDIEEKRTIISSMFPEFLEFDGIRHRTQGINSAVTFYYHNTKELEGKRMG